MFGSGWWEGITRFFSYLLSTDTDLLRVAISWFSFTHLLYPPLHDLFVSILYTDVQYIYYIYIMYILCTQCLKSLERNHFQTLNILIVHVWMDIFYGILFYLLYCINFWCSTYNIRFTEHQYRCRIYRSYYFTFCRSQKLKSLVFFRLYVIPC